MTVAELIAELQKYPKDLPVIVTQQRGPDYQIQGVVQTFECLSQTDEVTIEIRPMPA
jgi:hypothetical protein